MSILKFCLAVCLTCVLILLIFVEITSRNKIKYMTKDLVKCQSLASNVNSKLRTKGLRSNNLFFEKLQKEIVIQCMKLESMR